MTQTIYTPAQIKSLFDLLAAQCSAGLIDGDAYHARRKELYELAHESIKAEELSRAHQEATCFFCCEERREANQRMDNSVLVRPSTAGEKIRGIRI